jgi:hypothetical protein
MSLEDDEPMYVCLCCGHEDDPDKFGKYCPECGTDLDEAEAAGEMANGEDTPAVYSYRGYVPETELPIKAGQRVKLSKGLRVKRPSAPASLPKEFVLKRSCRITVDHVLPGSSVIGRDDYPVTDPKIVWSGSGGYWCELLFRDLVEAGIIPARP